jgi:hypothetical protein
MLYFSMKRDATKLHGQSNSEREHPWANKRGADVSAGTDERSLRPAATGGKNKGCYHDLPLRLGRLPARRSSIHQAAAEVEMEVVDS